MQLISAENPLYVRRNIQLTAAVFHFLVPGVSKPATNARDVRPEPGVTCADGRGGAVLRHKRGEDGANVKVKIK